MESCAFAGMPLTMYVGSMYLTSQDISARRRLTNHGPISPNIGFPPLSVPPAPCTYSCPAPSATTTTAWPCFFSRLLMCCTTPPAPSMAKSTSGIIHTSTSPDASEAFMAMKPLCRPISLTTPTPFNADLASIAAARIAFCASSTAVSNPNVLSMCRISLSMVFGIPTTETASPRRAHSSLMASAPAWLPFPPITNTMLMPCRSIESTILGTSPPPRPVPITDPPALCTPDVLLRVSFKLDTPSFQKPPNPNLIPEISLTPYPVSRVVTTLRITSLIPGHKPPQFTMAACVVAGSW
mmetsp:Transcript_104/g.429  ORF Transcript_104/g.429 Transcript_104/m.429 type:complete len:296 (-) Transcript_104:591-1478(-)